MTPIAETLKQRDAKYGTYIEQARLAQNIQDDLVESQNWRDLAPDQKQALIMFAVKMSRILTGDPNYHDNWHDIEGYAKLVADRLIVDSLK